MASYVARSFSDTSVELDGNEFIDCVMDRCELVFRGNQLPLLRNNRLRRCRFHFEGAAHHTVYFLAGLVQIGMKEAVLSMIESAQPATVHEPRPTVRH